MSWQPEVLLDGRWETSGLRFETEREASVYAADLFRRWTLTQDHRAAESDDPVTHVIDENNVMRSLVAGLETEVAP